jgi:hypothetical protein
MPPPSLWDLAGDASTWTGDQVTAVAKVTVNWGNTRREAYQLLDGRVKCRTDDDCWLVVESSLTVAQVWRLGWGGGVVEVAHGLLRDGIYFHWLHPCRASYHIKRPPKRDEWNTSLGWRASPEECMAYEQYRNTYVAWNAASRL